MLETTTKGRATRLAATTLAVAVALAAGGAGAEEGPPAVGDPDLPWLDNSLYKVHLDVRARIELANSDPTAFSQAYTIRTRAGLEAKPFYGFSAFAELENTWSLAKDEYFDGASTPNGKTTIADPSNIELNRAWLQYARADVLGEPVLGAPLGAKAKAGRQRIIFDDARFIGNVGWRQNEQTFDSALGESNFGVENLTVQYAYLWDIRRIFGDQGPTPASHDWSSDSSLARVHYAIGDHQLTGFIYALDFKSDSPGNSANSYGFRAVGSFALGDEFKLGYQASYAYQTDAGDNPVDYDANYVWAGLDGTLDGVGMLGVVFEMLGSDDGDARFVTPLATAHKFNGWADVFLNNGGNDGLRDLAITVAPQLPWKLKGQVVFHEFWSDEGGHHLGREVDAVLSRPINEYVSVLTKGAWFDGTSRGPADTWRYWVQLEFKY